MKKLTSKKLTSKDLINIGIFTALYLVASCFPSAIRFVPFLHLAMAPLVALITAPIFLLYLEKVPKPFAITICGIICSVLVGLLVYGNVYSFIICLTIFLLAEFAAHLNKYKKFKMSFYIASFWTLGVGGISFFFPNYFIELSVNGGYEKVWAESCVAVSTPLNFVLVILATLICSFISIKFTELLFKKHFKKTGIVNKK